MLDEQTKLRFKKVLFWIGHLFFPALLIWMGTSNSPSVYQMVAGISIIVIFVSIISLLIVGIKSLLKKSITKHRPIRPVLSILISLVLLTIWDTSTDDAQQYLWKLAEKVQQECFVQGCVKALADWETRDIGSSDQFTYKQGYYENRLKWRLQYTANKQDFELFWYLGFDGPTYGICGGIDKALKKSDSNCRPSRPK